MRHSGVTRIQSLDGLRGFAVFVVAGSHFCNLIGYRTFGSGAGQIGVMIFFMLSGFLMGHLYSHLTLTRLSVILFLQKRVARVIPLYFLVIVASFLLTLVFDGPPSIAYPISSFSQLAEHVLMLRGESVLWTVVIEVQFYVLFPLFWLTLHLIGRDWALSAFATLIVALLVYQLDPVPENASVRSLNGVAHFFVIGLMISLFPNTASKSRLWDCFFIGGVVAVFLLYPGVLELTSTGAWFKLTPKQMWTSPIYMFVVGVLLISTLRSAFASSFFGSWPMRWMGSISYSFYLLHDVIFRLLGQIDVLTNNSFLFFGVAMAVAMMIASVSYIMIELPSRRLIAHFPIETSFIGRRLPLFARG